MELLTIPNWSFSDQKILNRFEKVLQSFPVKIHYLQADIDHNRTVSAFSGEDNNIYSVLCELCKIAFDEIDITEQKGVHPKLGVLDICPFVLKNKDDFHQAQQIVEKLGTWLDSEYDLPVFLYEQSSLDQKTSLPSLRSSGLKGKLFQEYIPNYGPKNFNSKLGVTVLGIRDFLIALNLNLTSKDIKVAQAMAHHLRAYRDLGNMGLSGVRALGLQLKSKDITQISLNVTQPDLTPPDNLIRWISALAEQHHTAIEDIEVIGVIRDIDLPVLKLTQVNQNQIFKIS